MINLCQVDNKNIFFLEVVIFMVFNYFGFIVFVYSFVQNSQLLFNYFF